MMRRRSFLAGGTAAVAAQGTLMRRAAAQSSASSVLRFVPNSQLTLLDPVWSTAYSTLCHAYAVFDAPYGATASQQPRPQMLEGDDVSTDGKVWTLRLREGLKFHDGQPVRAADCVASFTRWASRQSTGLVVGAFVDSWTAADDRTVKVTLKRPLPTFSYLMANSTFPAFVMPERLAKTEASKQITEMVGSGPFRFLAGEFVAGSRAVYEKFDDYVPRKEPAEWTAGGKVANVKRIEWTSIPDASTAVSALQKGEIDWLEALRSDLEPLVARRQDIRRDVIDPSGWTGFVRFNHLTKPFNNVAIRRAVMMAVDQNDYLRVVAGDDPANMTVCKSMFACGTPLGRPEAGAGAMRADRAAAKALLKEAGYAGEKVVILQPADLSPYGDFSTILATELRDIGMNVDLVASDWGTVTQRRAKKEPVEQGGWSIFVSGVNGPVLINPAVNFLVRGQGERGYFGWYDNAEVERLSAEWLESGTEADRNRLADLIQKVAFETVPYVPLGQYTVRTAYRSNITGVLRGPAVLPWNVTKA